MRNDVGQHRSSQDGLFADLRSFMVENIRWWLVPLMISLGLIVVTWILGYFLHTPSPFIYFDF